jgi:hypothetical protein
MPKYDDVEIQIDLSEDFCQKSTTYIFTLTPYKKCIKCYVMLSLVDFLLSEVHFSAPAVEGLFPR